MHNRHWVGRNRGKNLKYGEKLNKLVLKVNVNSKTALTDRKSVEPPDANVIATDLALEAACLRIP